MGRFVNVLLSYARLCTNQENTSHGWRMGLECKGGVWGAFQGPMCSRAATCVSQKAAEPLTPNPEDTNKWVGTRWV